jgi:hypothetical protein
MGDYSFVVLTVVAEVEEMALKTTARPVFRRWAIGVIEAYGSKTEDGGIFGEVHNILEFSPTVDASIAVLELAQCKGPRKSAGSLEVALTFVGCGVGEQFRDLIEVVVIHALPR